MATLLEQALNLPRGYRKRATASAEEKELALAWADGKVSFTDLAKVLGTSKTSAAFVYGFLCLALRDAILDGDLVKAPHA